ncbi:MAG: hypothetical protein P8Z74_08990 [Acidobacteriota bacterium]
MSVGCRLEGPAQPGVASFENGSRSAIRSRRIHPRLPVFRVERQGGCHLYTPGTAVRLDPALADRVEEDFSSGSTESVRDQPRIRSLIGNAARVQREWTELQETPFAAESLTIIPTGRCSFRCSYCFTRGHREIPAPRWGEDEILAIVEPILMSCLDRRKTFTLAVHGGGEPTEACQCLETILPAIRRRALQLGVPTTRYLATNGRMPETLAAWVAREFTLVGLSCDGPPDIQDRQRPLASGGGRTSQDVIRFARLMHDRGARVQARATITPRSMTRQVEIARFLADELRIGEIRLEPVYGAGSAAFRPEDAPTYAWHFLAARDWAARRGVSLSQSGLRPHELHGPFCEALRNTIRLTAAGEIANCFYDDEGQNRLLGRLDPRTKTLEPQRIQGLRSSALRIPEECHNCFCSLHCSKGCPDVCRVESESPRGTFRCRLNQELGWDLIRRNGPDGESCDAKG